MKVIVLPETKLDGYQTYRSDRNPRSSKKITDGCCLIAVKDTFFSSQIPTADDGVEHLFIKVSNKFSKIIVASCYMSKECNLDKYVKHVRTAEQIATRFTNFGMLVIGDYNLSGVNWHPNDDIFYDTRYATRQDIVGKVIY